MNRKLPFESPSTILRWPFGSDSTALRQAQGGSTGQRLRVAAQDSGSGWQLRAWLATAILMAVLAAACAPATPFQPTPDINAIKTSVAHTVVAEITLTAAAFTPTPAPPAETPTPEITATPTTLVTDPTLIAQGTPGVLCDSLTFDDATVDVNIPDLTQMTPSQEFVKTWKVKNDGSCAWGDGYGLIYAYGEKMSGVPQPLGTVVEVGQEVDISINFKAPDKLGEYVSAWQMTNASGIPFGKPLYVKIIVK